MNELSRDGVPYGHSRISHQVLGFCFDCPERTVEDELIGWRLKVSQNRYVFTTANGKS